MRIKSRRKRKRLSIAKLSYERSLAKALIEARQIIRDNLKPDITDNELHRKLKIINDTIIKYEK